MQCRFMLCVLSGVVLSVFSACNSKNKNTHQNNVLRGLYSFGPESKSFKDCASGHEYWVADSSAKLELAYSDLGFEKPYEPVYIEVEGVKVRSDEGSEGSEFDSTLVVKKLVKITREIPRDMCR